MRDQDNPILAAAERLRRQGIRPDLLKRPDEGDAGFIGPVERRSLTGMLRAVGRQSRESRHRTRVRQAERAQEVPGGIASARRFVESQKGLSESERQMLRSYLWTVMVDGQGNAMRPTVSVADAETKFKVPPDVTARIKAAMKDPGARARLLEDAKSEVEGFRRERDRASRIARGEPVPEMPAPERSIGPAPDIEGMDAFRTFGANAEGAWKDGTYFQEARDALSGALAPVGREVGQALGQSVLPVVGGALGRAYGEDLGESVLGIPAAFEYAGDERKPMFDRMAAFAQGIAYLTPYVAGVSTGLKAGGMGVRAALKAGAGQAVKELFDPEGIANVAEALTKAAKSRSAVAKVARGTGMSNVQAEEALKEAAQEAEAIAKEAAPAMEPVASEAVKAPSVPSAMDARAEMVDPGALKVNPRTVSEMQNAADDARRAAQEAEARAVRDAEGPDGPYGEDGPSGDLFGDAPAAPPAAPSVADRTKAAFDANDARIAELERKVKGAPRQGGKRSGAASPPSRDEIELALRQMIAKFKDGAMTIADITDWIAGLAAEAQATARQVFAEVAGALGADLKDLGPHRLDYGGSVRASGPIAPRSMMAPEQEAEGRRLLQSLGGNGGAVLLKFARGDVLTDTEKAAGFAYVVDLQKEMDDIGLRGYMGEDVSDLREAKAAELEEWNPFLQAERTTFHGTGERLQIGVNDMAYSPTRIGEKAGKVVESTGGDKKAESLRDQAMDGAYERKKAWGKEQDALNDARQGVLDLGMEDASGGGGSGRGRKTGSDDGGSFTDPVKASERAMRTLSSHFSGRTRPSAAKVRDAVRQLFKDDVLANPGLQADEYAERLARKISDVSGAGVSGMDVWRAWSKAYDDAHVARTAQEILVDRAMRNLKARADFMAKSRSARAAEVFHNTARSLSRQMLSGLDVSLPFTHGIPTLLSRPAIWIRAWKPTLEALRGGEPAVERYAARQASDPWYQRAVRDGVSFRSMGGDIVQMEESAQGYLVEHLRKVPGLNAYFEPLARSNEAGVVFLNEVSKELYRKFASSAPRDKEIGRSAAETVNLMTLRGHGKTAEWLRGSPVGLVMYAPSFTYAKGQLPLMALYGRKGGIGAKEFARQVTAATMVLAAARMLGYEVEADPNDMSRFGTVHLPNGATIQPFRIYTDIPGFVQRSYKNIEGEATKTKKPGAFASGLWRYYQGKASPGAKFLIEGAMRERFDYDEYEDKPYKPFPVPYDKEFVPEDLGYAAWTSFATISTQDSIKADTAPFRFEVEKDVAAVIAALMGMPYYTADKVAAREASLAPADGPDATSSKSSKSSQSVTGGAKSGKKAGSDFLRSIGSQSKR